MPEDKKQKDGHLAIKLHDDIVALSKKSLIHKNNMAKADLMILIFEYTDKVAAPPLPVPHRCPIFGGCGKVPGGFYLSVGLGSTSTNVTESCRSCLSTPGILWSYPVNINNQKT